MNIQAVFFDMGGTIDTFGYTRELRLARTPGIQERLLKAGIDLDLDNEGLYQVISAGLDRYKTWCLDREEEKSPEQVWSEFILAEYSYGQDALASIAEDLMCYIETRYFDRKVRPEAPGVLEVIRRMGIKIGLISNVNSRGQVPTNLTEYQIIDYFDPIVLSSEFGRRKPDPAIFHHAARLARVPTSRCLFVGDRINRDILGAQRAGFGLTVQINHVYNHHESDLGATPDFVIDQMTELVDILKSVQEPSSSIRQSVNKGKSPIRALLLDAGEILYFRTEKGRYLNEFLKSLNIDPGDDRESKRYALRQQAFRGEILQKEYQIAVLRLYGVDQPEQIIQGLDAIKKDEDNVIFYQGVRETLVTLKEEGYLLGVVTDTANSIHTKLSWFELGGIGHLWDSFTSSMVVGVRKPDPKMYQAALDQLGVAPSEAIFIGHKVSELDGARAVGLKTIAFNYEKDALADYYVENFADILNVPLISLEKETLIGN